MNVEITLARLFFFFFLLPWTGVKLLEAQSTTRLEDRPPGGYKPFYLYACTRSTMYCTRLPDELRLAPPWSCDLRGGVARAVLLRRGRRSSGAVLLTRSAANPELRHLPFRTLRSSHVSPAAAALRHSTFRSGR